MTTEELIKQLAEDPRLLSRDDIANVIVSIGAPGEKRAEKRAAIKKLTEDKLGNHSQSFGGHHIYDALEDWVQY